MQNLNKYIYPDPVAEIEFIENPPVMIDDDLTVVILSKNPPDFEKGFSPFYRFNMINSYTKEKMGSISLRIGYTPNDVNYRGNIGFSVEENYRGKNYAARSCRLILPVIKFHKFKHVWLTCDDDNYASIKTMEKIGAVFIETVKIPDDYPYLWYYPEHSRTKRRYKWFVF